MWLAWNVCLVQAGPWTVNLQQNVWVTLANMTRQESLCLSMATPKDPFRTRQIGIPIYDLQEFKGYVKNETWITMRDSAVKQEFN